MVLSGHEFCTKFSFVSLMNGGIITWIFLSSNSR